MPSFHSDTRPELSSNEEARLCLEENQESLLCFITTKLGADGASAAPDIWQEISLAVHQHSFSADPIANPSAWLRKLASHKIADYWRTVHRGRNADRKWAQAQPFDFGTSPSDWVLDQSRRTMVKEVLGQMEDSARHLLREKYLLGRTVAEIAARENRSEKSIEHRLAQARNSFRNILSREP